jgi:hypothetical protein
MPPTTSADDTLIAAHLASGILAATMRVASVENPSAQAPLAAKLYFDCHDALRAEARGAMRFSAPDPFAGYRHSPVSSSCGRLGRTADDAQDLGGRCLLLQCLVHSSNDRTLSIAITAWSAKVVTSRHRRSARGNLPGTQ